MAAGVGAKAIAHRIDVGRLHPVHRGVYTVGHRVLGVLGQWLAAVSACGEGAVLSHRSAAAAWKIRPLGDVLPIDVTVAGSAGRKRRGIVAHRDRLDRRDVTALGAIPITTPSRTLVDVAAAARSDRQIEKALDEARYRGLLDRRTLDAAMDRATFGVRALGRVLSSHDPGSTRTRSGLEEAFLALIRAAALPLPLVNVKVGRMTVDFLWPEGRVIVETDGDRYHDTPSRRARDARRDALLRRWRYQVIRVSQTDLRDRALAVTQLVTSALS